MTAIRQSFGLRHFDKCLLRHRMHDNGAVWPHRADMFAAATTYAYCRVGLWDHQVVVIGDHAHCLGWAVFSAGAAVFAVRLDYAEMFFVFNLADFHELFPVGGNRLYCIDRAYLRAKVAVLLTHAEVKVQCWFEQAARAFWCGMWFND